MNEFYYESKLCFLNINNNLINDMLIYEIVISKELSVYLSVLLLGISHRVVGVYGDITVFNNWQDKCLFGIPRGQFPISNDFLSFYLKKI